MQAHTSQRGLACSFPFPKHLHPAAATIPAGWNRQSAKHSRGRGLSREGGLRSLKSSPSSALSSSSCADQAVGHPSRLACRPLHPASIPARCYTAVPLRWAQLSLCLLVTTKQKLHAAPGEEKLFVCRGVSHTDGCWNDSVFKPSRVLASTGSEHRLIAARHH